jgi:hypothetical protein
VERQESLSEEDKMIMNLLLGERTNYEGSALDSQIGKRPGFTTRQTFIGEDLGSRKVLKK